MNPVLQEILHNITTRLAALEEFAQSEKLLVDLIQEQRAEIDRLRQALAQPEQEELIQFNDGKWSYVRKPWQGLTQEEILILNYELKDVFPMEKIIERIELKIKEKNT